MAIVPAPGLHRGACWSGVVLLEVDDVHLGLEAKDIAVKVCEVDLVDVDTVVSELEEDPVGSLVQVVVLVVHCVSLSHFGPTGASSAAQYQDRMRRRKSLSQPSPGSPRAMGR